MSYQKVSLVRPHLLLVESHNRPASKLYGKGLACPNLTSPKDVEFFIGLKIQGNALTGRHASYFARNRAI